MKNFNLLDFTCKMLLFYTIMIFTYLFLKYVYTDYVVNMHAMFNIFQ